MRLKTNTSQYFQFSVVVLALTACSSALDAHNLQICKVTEASRPVSGSFNFGITGLSSSFPSTISVAVRDCHYLANVGTGPFTITEEEVAGIELSAIGVTGAVTSSTNL